MRSPAAKTALRRYALVFLRQRQYAQRQRFHVRVAFQGQVELRQVG